MVHRFGSLLKVESEIVFKALADRTRQRALGLLSRHELSVSELVELLRQPQSTVSRHLKVLREARLIRDRRNGNTVLYSVPAPPNGAEGFELNARLLEWAAEQPLAPALTAKLEALVDRRRDMSDRFFAEVGRQWDTLREESFGTAFHLEALVTLLPPRWTVADIGTGTGYMLPTLAEHFERVIGVDPVEAMLEAARRRVDEHRASNVELRRGDLSQLPILDAAVDLSLAMLVLHHVPSPQEALAELYRIARPGGRVLVVEQTAHRDERFRDRMQDRWWGFEPDELTAMIHGAGFEKIRSHGLSSVELAPDAPELFVVTGRRAVAAEN